MSRLLSEYWISWCPRRQSSSCIGQDLTRGTSHSESDGGVIHLKPEMLQCGCQSFINMVSILALLLPGQQFYVLFFSTAPCRYFVTSELTWIFFDHCYWIFYFTNLIKASSRMILMYILTIILTLCRHWTRCGSEWMQWPGGGDQPKIIFLFDDLLHQVSWNFSWIVNSYHSIDSYVQFYVTGIYSYRHTLILKCVASLYCVFRSPWWISTLIHVTSMYFFLIIVPLCLYYV